MTTPETKPVRKLTEIFAQTDTISFGPLSVSMNGDNSFKQAIFKAHGIEINLSATEKKLMAMLIAQQGEALTIKMLEEGADVITNPKSIQLQVSSIRKKTKQQLSGQQPDEIIDLVKNYIKPVNPVHVKGQKGAPVETEGMSGAYRLSIPSLS